MRINTSVDVISTILDLEGSILRDHAKRNWLLENVMGAEDYAQSLPIERNEVILIKAHSPYVEATLNLEPMYSVEVELDRLNARMLASIAKLNYLRANMVKVVKFEKTREERFTLTVCVPILQVTTTDDKIESSLEQLLGY